MAELHSRFGRPRKDGRSPAQVFVRCREPVADEGPLSGEDALRILESLDDHRGREDAVARICRQVACSGARPSRSAGGAA